MVCAVARRRRRTVPFPDALVFPVRRDVPLALVVLRELCVCLLFFLTLTRDNRDTSSVGYRMSLKIADYNDSKSSLPVDLLPTALIDQEKSDGLRFFCCPGPDSR